MKRLRLQIFMALCVTAALASCTKKGNDGATGPAGPAGPSLHGAINGYVNVYDQYGTKVLNGANNVNVTLKGVSTILTDASGYFLFGNVTSGGYAITASGTGLASTMVSNIGFVSDTFFTNVRMSAKPTFNLISFKAYHNAGSLFDSLVMTLPADTRPRNVIVFAHNNRSVSNTPGNYVLSVIKPVPALAWAGTQTIILRISASELNAANIFYGEQAYFAACSYVVNDASLYTDPATGKDVYNATGTALIDSATAP